MKPRLIFGIECRNLCIPGAKRQPGFIALWRKAKRMKRARSPRVTPEMAAHIKFLVKDQKLFQHQVAALCGINQGRVSEVMRGKFFKDVPPAQGAFPF